ncbi:VWA domain-containing protein [Actinomadura craniellae]|uniref:VWA domain-containing protein n=1 Tax=Actinomadura craniellae TaxID=2231787 RepID=A0A365GVB5_9ACTN|nr:substrate-binding and VWA domain-containing protein [Actinomadura craniellae]RAY10728.1 VWA domain-containing protein [Actinomadura craniellae]
MGNSTKGLVTAAALAVALLAGGAWWTLKPGPGDRDCAGTTRLRLAASQDKVGVLQRAADAYARTSDVDGMCVRVTVDSKNSGTAMLALARGWNEREDGPRPDIWSPASTTWVTLLRERAQQADRPSPVIDGEVQPIMTSPLTIAMPEPMARALGWPDKPLGWEDLTKLATDPRGWAAYGHPEWGAFRLGKTNPNLSTSGLNATIGAYFSTTGTTGDLTPADIADRENRAFVHDLEKSIVHYGATTLTFLSNLQQADDRGQALSYISAVTVEEGAVWHYNQGNPAQDPATLGRHRPPSVPLVAVYPKEGTLYSDHPYVPLAGLTPAKRKAADDFLRYLHGPQSRALFDRYGWRDHQRRAGPTIQRAPGLNPATFEARSLPGPRVLDLVLQSWSELRKPANVLLVVDRSGSMTEPVPGTGKNKGDLAKTAAIESLVEFRGHDRVGLWAFSSRLDGDRDWQELVTLGPMDANRRTSLRARLSGLPLGGGTGLYNTVAAAYEKLRAAPDEGAINAVVVLTDGKNETQGGLGLEDLLGRLRAGEERRVRVFAIGYGKDADQRVLGDIARAAEGASYDSADPNGIREVFAEVISNF